MPFPQRRPSIVAAYIIAATVAFWTVALFVDAPILRDIFNNLSLGVAVMVLYHWFGAAVESVRGRRNGAAILILGIYFLFIILAYSRILSISAILMDRPLWLIDGPLAAFLPYMVTGAGLMFLIAPGIADEAPTRWYFKHIIVAVALGAGVAGFMLARTLE